MGNNCVRECERTQEQVNEVNPNAVAANSVPGFGGPCWPDGSTIKVGAMFTTPQAAIVADGLPASSPSRASNGGNALTPLNLSPNASPRTEGSAFDTPRCMESPRPPEEGKTEMEPSTTPGQIYTGQMKGQKKHGVGRLEITDGPGRARYDGEFYEDLKHGHGVLTWQDGRQYRGQFLRDKFHGEAVMTWPDGRRYVGQYADDRKHGDGTFSWQDGRRYEGQWVMGKRHGTGVYTNAKAVTRTGTWNMDRPLRWENPAPDEDADGSRVMRGEMMG